MAPWTPDESQAARTISFIYYKHTNKIIIMQDKKIKKKIPINQYLFQSNQKQIVHKFPYHH